MPAGDISTGIVFILIKYLRFIYDYLLHHVVLFCFVVLKWFDKMGVDTLDFLI